MGTGPGGVEWTLGDGDEQRVEAVLLDFAGQPLHLPIRFAAGFGAGGEEPGIQVTDIRFDTGEPLRNDAHFPVAFLGRGITVECAAEVEEGVVRAGGSNQSKPVCFVTLHLPFPFNRVDMELWGQPVLGTRPLRLEAQLAVDDNEIFWIPTEDVRSWLNGQLFPMMQELDRGDRVLAYLTLEGDFVWARREDEADLPRYLDGEVFGRLRADGGTDAVLPSGDGRQGGELEMWFWLVGGGSPSIGLEPDELDFGRVPVGGSELETLTVFNGGDGPLTVQARVVAEEAFAIVSSEAFTVEPGRSADVRIRFAPDRQGDFSDHVTVSSNDPDRPTLRVPLAGTGEGVTVGTAFVQLVHNAVDTGPIDVSLNGEATLERLPYREGTAYQPFDAGALQVRVDSAEGQRLLDRVVDLESDRAYVLIACRESSDAENLRLMVVAGARRVAESEETVDFVVASGLVSAEGRPVRVNVRVLEPEVDNSFLADNLATCQRATRYQSLPPVRAVLAVDADDEQHGEFPVDLNERGGHSFVLLVSGRLEAEGPDQLALIGFDAGGSRIF